MYGDGDGNGDGDEDGDSDGDGDGHGGIWWWMEFSERFCVLTQDSENSLQLVNLAVPRKKRLCVWW